MKQTLNKDKEKKHESSFEKIEKYIKGVKQLKVSMLELSSQLDSFFANPTLSIKPRLEELIALFPSPDKAVEFIKNHPDSEKAAPLFKELREVGEEYFIMHATFFENTKKKLTEIVSSFETFFDKPNPSSSIVEITTKSINSLNRLVKFMEAIQPTPVIIETIRQIKEQHIKILMDLHPTPEQLINSSDENDEKSSPATMRPSTSTPSSHASYSSSSSGSHWSSSSTSIFSSEAKPSFAKVEKFIMMFQHMITSLQELAKELSFLKKPVPKKIDEQQQQLRQLFASENEFRIVLGTHPDTETATAYSKKYDALLIEYKNIAEQLSKNISEKLNELRSHPQLAHGKATPSEKKCWRATPVNHIPYYLNS